MAAFPPPHTFFFTREKDTNLGYVWYRKDAEGNVRHRRRHPRARGGASDTSQNFALYNAPPGTVQKMGVYFYASPDAGRADAAGGDGLHARRQPSSRCPATRRSSTTSTSTSPARQRASGSLDTPFQDLPAMRSLGLNVIGLSDFHFELHANDPGPLRFPSRRTTSKPPRTRLGQGLPGGAVGRAERVLRRPLQHPVAEGRVLDEGATGRTSRSSRTIRATARSITPATPKTCRR